MSMSLCFDTRNPGSGKLPAHEDIIADPDFRHIALAGILSEGRAGTETA